MISISAQSPTGMHLVILLSNIILILGGYSYGLIVTHLPSTPEILAMFRETQMSP